MIWDGDFFGFWLDVLFQVVVVAGKESQPVVRAASCAATTTAVAGRLCRHSAQTHPLQCVCAVSCLYVRCVCIQIKRTHLGEVEMQPSGTRGNLVDSWTFLSEVEGIAKAAPTPAPTPGDRF